MAAYRRMKLDHLLSPYAKINLKQIKDLNISPESIKLLEGNISNNLLDFNLSSILLDLSPKAKKTKAKVNSWEYMKLNGFCTLKENINTYSLLNK